MSGIIPSFLSSAKLVIYIDGKRAAYATNLTFSDRMSAAPVGGIGSYNADALEPLQYAVNGSFAITMYDEQTLSYLKSLDPQTRSLIPMRATAHEPAVDASKAMTAAGNSMLTKNFFSPVHLMISRTIDIHVYERAPKAGQDFGAVMDEILTYTVRNARLSSYSLTFTPGSLLQEQIGFVAMQMVDELAQAPVIGATE